MWRRALRAGIEHGPDPWLRYSPALFGLAFGAALKTQRRAVRDNLRWVCGPRPYTTELRDVAEVFTNFACSMTDAMLIGASRGYTLTSRPVGDWAYLSSAAAGKGVILASAHTAGWDVGGFSAARLMPARVMVVMEPEANARARDVHDATRTHAGVQLVHVGTDPLAALPVLKHLRHGGVVALQYDRIRSGMRTRTVRFLGRSWEIPQGPLTLARLSGAPIVPVFGRRLGFLEYQVIATPPIQVPPRASSAQLDAVAQTMAERLEQFVRAYPTHWFRFTVD